MEALTIKTNNQYRELLSGWELSQEEKNDLDYIEDIEDQCNRFFRYLGEIYDIQEFFRVIPTGSKRCHPTECDNIEFQGWDGYMSDSFFSGVLVKFDKEDEDYIIVGRYYC